MMLCLFSNSQKALCCFCLFIGICLTGCVANGQPDKPLLAELREKGLALPVKDVFRIEQQPHHLQERRAEMVPGYSHVVKALAGERTRLSGRFSRADSSEKERIESEALEFIEDSFRFLLFPLWAGGKWSLGGRADNPQSGPMACGYFLERMMRDLGFNIRPIKGYTMGQLATDEMMWSFKGRYQENLRNWKGFEAYLKSEGPGLYLVGLSSRWGHVLFLRYTSKDPPLLYHSGPGLHGLKVQVDPAEEYIRDLMKPHVIHAAKINREMARKWLARAPIQPVKCKTFGSRAARKRSRLAQVQENLRRLGFYSGSIDGKFGPGTRSAIGRFQKSSGMPVTLLPNGQTMKSLEVAVAGIGVRTASTTVKYKSDGRLRGDAPVPMNSNIREAK